MAYTITWYRTKKIGDEEYRLITGDLKTLLPELRSVNYIGWPLEASGPAITDTNIKFSDYCDMGAEACVFPKISDRTPLEYEPYGRMIRYECNTGGNKYAFAVQCLMIIAKQHLRNNIMIHDNGLRDWEGVRLFCRRKLWYGRRFLVNKSVEVEVLADAWEIQ